MSISVNWCKYFLATYKGMRVGLTLFHNTFNCAPKKIWGADTGSIIKAEDQLRTLQKPEREGSFSCL